MILCFIQSLIVQQNTPRIKLKHPNDVPVVDISGPNSKFSIYVPAELCEIEPGQPFRGRLNEKETSNMIRFACNPPKVNADAIIENGLPTLGFTPGTLGSPLSGFGITVDNNMTVVPGRELPPPRLTYEAGGRPLNVSNGSWNILDVKFHNGGAIKSWWVMVVREKDGRSVFSGADDPNLTGIWRGFGEKCRNSGISLGSQPVKLAIARLSRRRPWQAASARLDSSEDRGEHIRERKAVIYTHPPLSP